MLGIALSKIYYTQTNCIIARAVYKQIIGALVPYLRMVGVLVGQERCLVMLWVAVALREGSQQLQGRWIVQSSIV